MDPLTLVSLTAAGTVLVAAGSGCGALLRPLAPSPATVRRAAKVTAAGTLAAGVALTGSAAAADDTPWTVSSPATASTAEATAPPGPDNPQAQPDGTVSTATVPPAAWTVTTVTPPAPAASSPRRPRAASRPSGPRRPSSRATLPRRAARAGRIVVQPGDTLSRLARQHRTTVRALVAANRATYPRLTANYVQAGWRLRIGGAR